MDRRRKYPQILRNLCAANSCSAIFLRAKRGTKKEAEEIAKNGEVSVKVIGYSDEIEKIMQSANVMISKHGGLTTFEAMACHLPIIADATTSPMPQEAGTVSLIARRGAGILLEKATDIVPTIQNLVADSGKYSRMKEAAANLTIPHPHKLSGK